MHARNVSREHACIHLRMPTRCRQVHALLLHACASEAPRGTMKACPSLHKLYLYQYYHLYSVSFICIYYTLRRWTCQRTRPLGTARRPSTPASRSCQPRRWASRRATTGRWSTASRVRARPRRQPPHPGRSALHASWHLPTMQRVRQGGQPSCWLHKRASFRLRCRARIMPACGRACHDPVLDASAGPAPHSSNSHLQSGCHYSKASSPPSSPFASFSSRSSPRQPRRSQGEAPPHCCAGTHFCACCRNPAAQAQATRPDSYMCPAYAIVSACNPPCACC